MERTHDEEIHTRINHVFRARNCVQILFRRFDQIRMNSRAKEQTSSQTVGESKIALDSCYEEDTKEVWEKNWNNLETLNTYPSKLKATILKALREQLTDNDLLNAVVEIAGPAPEIFREYDQILERKRRILG